MMPAVAVRRTILLQKQAALQQEGYTALMDLEIAKAQDLGNDPQRTVTVQVGQQAVTLSVGEYFTMLEQKIRNASAAALRLQAMLDELRGEHNGAPD